MDIDFDEALRVARRCVADRTGDHDAVVARYEKGEDHYFQFHTRKGDRGVVIDRKGTARHCFEEDLDDIPPGKNITQREAVERALEFIGNGTVERVKAKEEGYEVDIEQEEKGTFRVFVERGGMVHPQKCSLLSRNLAADID
jgi:hypothetical protein